MANYNNAKKKKRSHNYFASTEYKSQKDPEQQRVRLSTWRNHPLQSAGYSPTLL